MPIKIGDAGLRHQIPARLDVGVRRALTQAGKILQRQLVSAQESLRPHTIATGATLTSQAVSPVWREGDIYFVRVGPQTPYAHWGIETGRAPGAPPPHAAIEFWLRNKPFAAGFSERELWIVAERIRWSIADKGTPAFNVVHQVWLANRAGFYHIFAREISSVLVIRGGRG